MTKSLLLTLLPALLFFAPLSALAAERVDLPVPFASEFAGGGWVEPWEDACEEASQVMVDQYYLGNTYLTRANAANLMKPLFDWEDKVFGSNVDTNAVEIARVINEFSSFEAQVIRNPTLTSIKAELKAKHPVIITLNSFALYGRLYGNGYHVMVLKGYDDATQEFISHNTGSQSKGANNRYSYKKIMSYLADFDHATKKVAPPPTALFTRPKFFARLSGTGRVYRIHDGKKYYVSRIQQFTDHNWSWRLVHTVSAEALAAWPLGGNEP